MAGRRYPEFYLRKRQRDRAYRRASFVVVGIAVCAVIGCGAGYWLWKVWLAGPRDGPVATVLAEERQQLQTDQLLSQADGRSASAPAAGQDSADRDAAAEMDLSDLEYEQSFPAVHVEVAADDTAGAAAAEGDGSGQEPPGGQAEPAAGEAPAAESSGGGQAEPAGTEPAQPAGPAAERTEEPPRAEAAVPDEAGGADGAPAADEDAGSAGAGDSTAAGDGGGGDAAGYVYHVYAGSFSSREQAEGAKNELSRLGYMAALVVLEPDYLLRVATLDDFNAADALKRKLADSGFSSAFATRSRR